MNDSICRQDAIDAVMKYGKQIPTFAIAVKDALENLPPAQLDRDVPKEPKEIMDSTWGIDKKQAVCPECDYYLGYVSFLGGRKGKKITYCEHCGQAIDWEGWIFDE